MSSNALLAALLVASATATAQTPAPAPSGTPAPAPAGAAPAAATPAPESTSSADSTEERIRQEVDKRVEAAKQEMREEIRAQLATQSLASDWQQEWVEEKRKLEIFTMDGYLRLRPNLYYQYDLGKVPGRELFPRSPRTSEKTQSFADMRLRLDPTFNISEDVRIKAQIDMLDNVVLGSTPYGSADQYNLFEIFNEGQDVPKAGINALKNSVQVKEVYGEVSTPVGLLRFGRMGAQWGLGILRNDGNCLECDYGDKVDRVMFVTQPLDGFYVTPMLEFNSEGAVAQPRGTEGEPVDLSNADDSHSLVLVIARRDTPQQVKAKLDNHQGVLNYGLHFSYRSERYSSTSTPGSSTATFTPRDATFYIPDVWLRYEERNFRVEFELASYIGRIGNRAANPAAAADPTLNQSLDVLNFGGAAVGEYRLLNGALNLQLEVGFASGDRAPGFGAYPGDTSGTAAANAIGGPQFTCGVGGCSDNAIRNFRFNRAYRVDNILWRDLIGTVTDAAYVKPTIRYTLTRGFDAFGSVIYSQAIYPESTPSTTERPLGIETNLGAKYETEDGFVARVDWSVLFPLGGLQEANTFLQSELKTAHSVRGTIGIRF